MSKIQQELAASTEVTKKRGQDDQEYLKALIKATSDLADAQWNKLSTEAQDWFNEAADAMNSKKDIPAFPDAVKEEKEETTTRRRGAAKEETKASPVVGDKVTIVTLRDKTISGKVVEIDKEIIVVDSDGEELEVAHDRIKSLTIASAVDKPSRRKAADDEPEAPAVAEPKVGDNITAVTARDKEYSGEVIEVDDDLVVIKDKDGEELKLTPSKLKSLVIAATEVKSSRRKAADDGEATTRSANKDAAAGDKPKRTSAKDNGGVSATVRMRELIVDDMEAKVDDIAKALKKEGIQYRDNTLNLVFADVHKLLAIMRAKKVIK